MTHLLAQGHPTSVLTAPAAAVAKVRFSLDSQESACSEETIRQEDVKLGWGPAGGSGSPRALS